MRRSLLATLPAAGLAVVLAAGAASAHECFIASRSLQGNVMAGTNSQAWFYVDLAVEFAHDPSIDPAAVPCLLQELTAHGVPLTFTIHVKGVNGQGGVLADHNPNEWLVANGTGVDHLFDVYGAGIAASFEACGVPFSVD